MGSARIQLASVDSIQFWDYRCAKCLVLAVFHDPPALTYRLLVLFDKTSP